MNTKKAITLIRKKSFGVLKYFRKVTKPLSKERKRKLSRFLWWLGLASIILGIFSSLTNPFMRFSVVNTETVMIDASSDQFQIESLEVPALKDNAFVTQLALLKKGWHIFSSKFAGGKKSSQSSVDQIILEIHQLRFDPDLPFLISGDHFSMFYLRSLGIFYHSLLDYRTALSPQDWEERQLIYAKSLIYALEVFAQSDRLTTTIVPIGPKSVALANIFAYPSDSLFSILYALEAMRTHEVHTDLYPFENNPMNLSIQTQEIVDELLIMYDEALVRHFNNYIEHVVNPDTGLIKKDLLLSSMKDASKRQSAFYDNVILWKTYQLADSLGIVELEENFLEDLKANIIETFWLEDSGYFLEHLSQDSIENKYYSSDWLIAYQVGFLNPNDPLDQKYLIDSVRYIQRNALDRPFALAYQSDIRRHETHFVPGLFAPTYNSLAIWSNWGMEYTKLLISLAQVTGDISYLNEAEHQISAYSFNIRRYRGYPEVYNQEGDFFRQFFYKSIRRTGWVVTYEQAREFLDWTKINWNNFEAE